MMNVDRDIQQFRHIFAGFVMKLSIPFLFLLLNVAETVVVAFQPTIIPSRNSMSSKIQSNRQILDTLMINHSPRHYQQQLLQSHEITSFARSRSSRQNIISVRGGVQISRDRVTLFMVGPSSPTEMEVRKGIDKVVSALRKDSRTNQELGKLQRVTIILGSGMQQMDTILAVRFNAAFQKSGPGLSSIPLPFGLGQSNVSEGRGTMVGQVKASINVKTGKVISCSVFRDLGYGRTFDLKV